MDFQLGLWEGPINKVGPISQPRGYHRYRVTHAGSYSRFLTNFSLGSWGDLFPHVRGAVSHHARGILTSAKTT